MYKHTFLTALVSVVRRYVGCLFWGFFGGFLLRSTFGGLFWGLLGDGLKIHIVELVEALFGGTVWGLLGCLVKLNLTSIITSLTSPQRCIFAYRDNSLIV